MRSENLLVAYWLTSVGIGGVVSENSEIELFSENQVVKVPLSDVLKYRRVDGSPQVDVIVLTGANFTKNEKFERPYLSFEPDLLRLLEDKRVIKELQEQGIKVVLCLVGGHGEFGWQCMPEDKVSDFVDYIKHDLLDAVGLDGIDIDDEYYSGEKTVSTLVNVVETMRRSFAPGTIISKALFRDIKDIVPQIAPYLTYGGLMHYGNDVEFLKMCYQKYREAGLSNAQLLIGVNAGPAIYQPEGNFTSLEATESLTRWHPEDGHKLGMMIWSFSQDIQQWTNFPQNQKALCYPNSNDHAWQRVIISAMESELQYLRREKAI